MDRTSYNGDTAGDDDTGYRPVGNESMTRAASANVQATASNQEVANPLYEGSTWCLWVVAAVVLLAGIVATFGYTTAATVIIAVTAIVTGLMRLFLRDRSPWQVRSVAFDAFIGIGLGFGLIALDLSIWLLL